MSKKYFLMLDDQRDPFDQNVIKFPDFCYDYELVWVKNYQDFTFTLKERGLPEVVAFDFDLIALHYQAGQKTGFTSLVGYELISEPTGLDCARALIRYCESNKKQLPKFFVHSQNPAGNQAIRSLLEKYQSKQNKEQNAPEN